MSEDLCMRLEEDFQKRLESVDERIEDLSLRLAAVEGYLARISGSSEPADLAEWSDGQV